MDKPESKTDFGALENSNCAQRRSMDQPKSPRTKRVAPPIPSTEQHSQVLVSSVEQKEDETSNKPSSRTSSKAGSAISSAILSMVAPLAQTSGGLKIQTNINRSPGSSIRSKRNPLVHQSSSSSPLRPSRIDSSYEGSDVQEQTFLSNFAASRPLAASGFLGVASAALAAARAGSPIGGHSPIPNKERQTKLNSLEHNQQRQHRSSISPNLLLKPASPRMGPRRHSDTMLTSIGSDDQSLPQIIMPHNILYCPRCNSFATRNQTLLHLDFRQMNCGQVTTENISSQPEWMLLNPNFLRPQHHLSMAQLPRSTGVSPVSSNITTAHGQEPGICPHCENTELVRGNHCSGKGYITAHNLPISRSQFCAAPSSTASSSKSPGAKIALDSLSAELMRANGLGGGFKQLKRAKDFKTAKEQQSHQQSPPQFKGSFHGRNQQKSVDSTSGSLSVPSSAMLHSELSGASSGNTLQGYGTSVRRGRLITANSIAVGGLGNRGSEIDINISGINPVNTLRRSTPNTGSTSGIPINVASGPKNSLTGPTPIHSNFRLLSNALASKFPILSKHLTRSTTVSATSGTLQDRKDESSDTLDHNLLHENSALRNMGHNSAPGITRACTEEDSNNCHFLDGIQIMTAERWKRQRTVDSHDGSMTFFTPHKFSHGVSPSKDQTDSPICISTTDLNGEENLESRTERSIEDDKALGVTLLTGSGHDNHNNSLDLTLTMAGQISKSNFSSLLLSHSADLQLADAKYPNGPIIDPVIISSPIDQDEQKPLLGQKSQKKEINVPSSRQANKNLKNIGYRLGKRKQLFKRRCRISDYALAFALFGIALMIMESEFVKAGIYEKKDVYSILMRSLISISTLVLIGLILGYHVLVIKIFSCDDSIEDWRIAIDRRRFAQMCLEVLICAIHPFPNNSSFQWFMSPPYSGQQMYKYGIPSHEAIKQIHIKNKTSGELELIKESYTFESPKYRTTSIDMWLSLPMFLRLYLIFRVILLHSKLFTDAGSRSIGAMNKVSFDTQFVLKTMMTLSPATVLLSFIFCLWIILSWMLRACEVVHDAYHGNMLNSMWVIAVTFLSIGYGDIVPNTYCGRAIAITAGVMGSGCTALVVAVFARKLELSKAEKHVIHFMMENKLTKKVKHYAANVLRETWLIYKYTKLAKRVNASKVRTHQRKFLKAIHGLRRTKMDHRKVQDSANTLVDLAKTQYNIYEVVADIREDQKCFRYRIDSLEDCLLKLQDQLATMPGLLRSIALQQHHLHQNGQWTTPLSQMYNNTQCSSPGGYVSMPATVVGQNTETRRVVVPQHTANVIQESIMRQISIDQISSESRLGSIYSVSQQTLNRGTNRLREGVVGSAMIDASIRVNRNRTHSFNKWNSVDETDLSPIPDQNEPSSISKKFYYSESTRRRRESFRKAKRGLRGPLQSHNNSIPMKPIPSTDLEQLDQQEEKL